MLNLYKLTFFFIFSSFFVQAQDLEENLLLENARKKYNSEKFDESIVLCNAILKKEGIRKRIKADCNYLMGEIYYSKKLYNLALSHFMNAKRVYSQLLFHSLKVANTEEKIGLCYLDLERYSQSVTPLLKAQYEYMRMNIYKDQARAMRKLGKAYYKLKNYEGAISAYMKSLSMIENLDDRELANLYKEVADVYYQWEKYKNALDFYESSLSKYEKINDLFNVADILKLIGDVHTRLGNYDLSLVKYIDSLGIYQTQQQEKKWKILNVYDSLGFLYFSWGDYEKSLRNYVKCKELFEKYKEHSLYEKRDYAEIRTKIGSVYFAKSEYYKALDEYMYSLSVYKSYPNPGLYLTNIYRSIGQVYEALKMYDIAIRYFKKSESDNKSPFVSREIAKDLLSIGRIYFRMAMQFEQEGLDINKFYYTMASDYYNKSLRLLIENGKNQEKAEVVKVYYHIGYLYYKQNEHKKAVNCFLSAISRLEKIRKTTDEKKRKIFLSTQILPYQRLVSSYVELGKIDEAILAMEDCKARILSEYLINKEMVDTSNLNVENLQNSLGDSAIVMYSNSNLNQMIHIVITKDKAFGDKIYEGEIFDELIKGKFGKKIYRKIQQIEKSYNENLHQKEFFVIEKQIIPQETNKIEVKKSKIFYLLVYYYQLLCSPSDKKDFEVIKRIGQTLYRFFLSPLENLLSGKKEIVIIPDGILGLIPFETLINAEGKYLVEKYNIRYAQSIKTLNTLKNRTYKNKSRNLSVAAFFGEYNYGYEYAGNSIERDSEIILLKEKLEGMDQENSLRELYGKLGHKLFIPFGNIGEEIEDLRKIFPLLEVYSKENGAEHELKKLSTNNQLTQYKILHFVAHGIFEDQIPELSALVLSQFKQEKNEQDGYLNVKEISELRLEADFVMLAACETGLGKIYLGEGVFNLIDPFMRAGANGVTASLWKVNSDTRRRFMKEFYSYVNKGSSYNEALNLTKRKFIVGSFVRESKYSYEPHYWSTFVYYGK